MIADVGAAGLGLPDRDYYVKTEKRFEDARAGYLEYIQKIFTLAGSSEADAKAAAQTIMTFETALAKASLDNVALRDPHATDHVGKLDALEKATPSSTGRRFSPQPTSPPSDVNMEQPAFMAEVERQLASTSRRGLEDLPALAIAEHRRARPVRAFRRCADSSSIRSSLAGVGELKPRGTRCAEQADFLLGEALGQEYVKRYFPPEAKQRAQTMVANILSAMRDTIKGLDWMTPATKQKALEKLSTFQVKIGYPDKWKDYSSRQDRPRSLPRGLYRRHAIRSWPMTAPRSASPWTAAGGA